MSTERGVVLEGTELPFPLPVEGTEAWTVLLFRASAAGEEVGDFTSQGPEGAEMTWWEEREILRINCLYWG